MKKMLLCSLLINLSTIPIVGYFIYKKYKQVTSVSAADQRRENRIDMFNMLETNENEIVFVGDSHIERCHWDELFNKPTIMNRGIGGDNSNGLLNRIEEIAAMSPLKLFIMIGINDIIIGRNPEAIILNYEKIIDKMKVASPSTQLFVHSVLPSNDKKWVWDKIDPYKVIEVNNKLALLKGCIYIDLYSEFVTDKSLNRDFTTDGLHLSGKGYQKWKSVIEPYLD